MKRAGEAAEKRGLRKYTWVWWKAEYYNLKQDPQLLAEVGDLVIQE